MKFFSIKNLVRFLILAVVVYAGLLFIGDFSNISKQLNQLNLLIIPEILGLVFIEYAISFLQWNYLLKKLGKTVPLKTSILVFYSGLSMAITPAKVGEILKSYLLKKTEGIRMRESIMIVVVERLVDMLSLAILALIGSFAFIRSPYYQILTVALIASLVFVFVMLTSKKIFFKTSSFLSRLPFIKKYVKYVDEIYKSASKLISIKTIAIVTTVSVFGWFIECFCFYLLLGALNVHLSLLICTFIFAFSSVFGAITLLPGGLGAAESSFVVLLVFIGVTLSTASLATILIRLCTLFWGIFIGTVSLVLLNRTIEM